MVTSVLISIFITIYKLEARTQPHAPTKLSHSHGTRRTRARLLRQAVSLSPVITENRLNNSKDSRRQPSRAQGERLAALFHLWREASIIGLTRSSNILPTERKPRDAGKPGGTGCFTLIGDRLLAQRSDKVLQYGCTRATQAKETPSCSPIL